MFYGIPSPNAVRRLKVSARAEEREELKTASTKWGTGKTGFQVVGFANLPLLFFVAWWFSTIQ
jgi:hypothetical protein